MGPRSQGGSTSRYRYVKNVVVLSLVMMVIAGLSSLSPVTGVTIDYRNVRRLLWARDSATGAVYTSGRGHVSLAVRVEGLTNYNSTNTNFMSVVFLTEDNESKVWYYYLWSWNNDTNEIDVTYFKYVYNKTAQNYTQEDYQVIEVSSDGFPAVVYMMINENGEYESMGVTLPSEVLDVNSTPRLYAHVGVGLVWYDDAGPRYSCQGGTLKYRVLQAVCGEPVISGEEGESEAPTWVAKIVPIGILALVGASLGGVYGGLIGAGAGALLTGESWLILPIIIAFTIIALERGFRVWRG